MASASATIPTPTAETAPDPRRWLILTIVLAAPLLAIFDQFVVNVAIATVQRELRASFGQIQLVVASYALAYAILLITGGRLGDSWGRKRAFILGLGGFTFASALCGLAPTPEILIGARILQGCTAAMMTPQTLAIIRVTFPRRELSTAFAIYGMILGLSGILGQVLGGTLIRADLFGLSWRPIFLINLPIGIAATVAAAFLLREGRVPGARGLDLGGVALATPGLFLLVFPLVVGSDRGWPLWSWLCLAAALPTLALFVAFERRLAGRGGAPLLELRLFRNRAFVLGLLTQLLIHSANAGYFLTLALYLQLGLRFTPLHAGLTFAPDAVGFLIAATLSARLIPRFGSRVLLAGVCLRMVGLGLVILAAARLGEGATALALIPGVFLQGFGSGSVSAPLLGYVLGNLPGRDAGSASGLLTTVQQIAGALGVAIIGLIFFTLLARGATGVADGLIPALRQELAATTLTQDEREAALGDFRACARDRAAERDTTTVPASCARPTLADATAAGPLGAGLTIAGARGYARAFVGAVGVAIGILALAAGCLAALPRRLTAPLD
jgi:EmrB/QacA subfamily drug resistance transporter